MSSAPAPQFDPVEPLEIALAPQPDATGEEPEQTETEAAAELPPYEYIGVIHLTRTWVQYGIFGFAVLCIVIGAVEALFGR